MVKSGFVNVILNLLNEQCYLAKKNKLFTMNIAYLILGGNKGDKLKNLQVAIEQLEKKAGRVLKKSDIYVTAAWGNTDQPDFFNQVVCLQTELSAHELLNQLLKIEEESGRIRDAQKWMERTLDIDILFFNDSIIKTDNLTIPHPYIQDRKFVLIPMAEVAPEFMHPELNKNIKTLLDECKDELEVKKKQQTF